MAYDIPSGRLVGGPAWISKDRFDIEATARASAAGSWARAAERREMLRALLEDRFQLKIHRETRTGSIYALTIARSDGRLGPNLTPTSPECATYLDAYRRA